MPLREYSILSLCTVIVCWLKTNENNGKFGVGTPWGNCILGMFAY